VVFVGYNNVSKGYKTYSLKNQKIVMCRYVKFNEAAKQNWDEGKVEST